MTSLLFSCSPFSCSPFLHFLSPRIFISCVSRFPHAFSSKALCPFPDSCRAALHPLFRAQSADNAYCFFQAVTSTSLHYAPRIRIFQLHICAQFKKRLNGVFYTSCYFIFIPGRSLSSEQDRRGYLPRSFHRWMRYDSEAAFLIYKAYPLSADSYPQW